jgi:hypothetical protein
MSASTMKFNNQKYIFKQKLRDDNHGTIFLVEDTQVNGSL